MLMHFNNQRNQNSTQMEQESQLKMQNNFNFYAGIPKDKRDQFYESVLSVKQQESPLNNLFTKDFTEKESFTYQGYKLNYYKLQNSNEPKAIVIHLHGYRGHGGVSGYYAGVIAGMNPEVNFYSFDQLNFGQSEGPCEGLIASLQDSAAQGEAFADHLLAKFHLKPKIFLSGSSFGGTIIFKMALNGKQKYDGLIFLSPALRDLKLSKPYAKKFGRLLSWIAPRIHLSLELTTKDIAKSNCDSIIRSDPHYGKYLVPAAVTAVLDGIDQVSQQFSALTTPYLMIQGGMDKSIDLFAPSTFIKQAPRRTSDMWHSVFLEEEVADFSLEAARWIKERV